MSHLYRFLASLARVAARSGRSKDLEIIMLGHQLAALRRQTDQPQLTHEIRELSIEMATNNLTRGYPRIHGGLAGLGHDIGASTVWRGPSGQGWD